MKTKTDIIINKLSLHAHPEGGYYKESYRSKEAITQDALPKRFMGNRNFSTGIYFMLTKNNFSAFHRIHQDEMWHFYDGAALYVHEIDNEGNYKKTEIGREFDKGQIPQYVVPAGVWFASSVKDEGEYSLVGCTVAPGFDFADFELAKRSELIQKFPQHEKIIKHLTRK